MNDIEKTNQQITAAMSKFEEVTQIVDPVEKNPMDVRHARELAKLIENGSEEDFRICAETLVRKAPDVVLDAIKARFMNLTDIVVEFKAMAKGL